NEGSLTIQGASQATQTVILQGTGISGDLIVNSLEFPDTVFTSHFPSGRPLSISSTIYNLGPGNINEDMKTLVPTIIGKSQEEVSLLLQMLLRAYDPCISCSTHLINVRFE
ncbi:MAG TPA: hypothetical protein PLR77_04770, partial [Caldisericia bacterium]|nr:hypothetical protein [Caldisericia bacterium]